MLKHFKWRTLLSVLLLQVLAGCASTGELIERPDVRLSAIEVTELGFSSQTVQLRFAVTNPNRFPLPVERVRYALRLAQEPFASGETGARFTVPAGGDAEFDLSVELDLLKSAARLLPILRAGPNEPLDYALHGSLAVDLPFARPLGFAHEGQIVLR